MITQVTAKMWSNEQWPMSFGITEPHIVAVSLVIMIFEILCNCRNNCPNYGEDVSNEQWGSYIFAIPKSFSFHKIVAVFLVTMILKYRGTVAIVTQATAKI